MFCMRGVPLRLSMVTVAGLWMYNAVTFNSPWQIASNVLNACAAGYGAWSLIRHPEPAKSL